MTRTARVQPGDTPANPITGERSTVTGTAAPANGELVVVELDLRPRRCNADAACARRGAPPLG